MYTVWLTSYCGGIFPYHTPLLHSAFSLPSSIITIDTMAATHAHMINQLPHTGNIAHCQGSIALVPVALVQYVP